MIAYLVLYVLAGPWQSQSAPGSVAQLARDRSLEPIIIAAFLAWRVTRGGWFSRGLIIVYTVLGADAMINSPAMRSGSLVSLGLLAIYAAQIALLVSSPVYDRTQRDSGDGQAGGSRLWEIPPRWMPIAAAVGGIAITLLFLGSTSYQPISACQARGYLSPRAAPLSQCGALAEGYPVHFLSALPSLSLASGNTVKAANLSMFADPVVSKGAAAEDMTIWTLACFTMAYLFWLPSRRPASSAAIAQPAPA